MALRAVDQIYEAGGDDAAFDRLPGVIAESLGARSAIVIEFDARMQPLGLTSHAISPDQHARYLGLGLGAHDVWAHLAPKLGRYDRATVCDDWIDPDSFRQTTFYNELYRPFGDDTARCMGATLRRPDGFLSIGLHRAYGHKPFGAEDAAALDGLLPHLRRLSAIRIRLRAAETRSSLVRAVVDGLASAVLICDAQGRLSYANERATLLLRGRSGFGLVGGKVTPLDSGIEARFAEAVRTAANGVGARGDALRVRRHEGGEALRVLVSPVGGSDRAALVLIDDPDSGAAALGETLRRLYGLTASEAALATMLHDGLSPQEAADTRGVRLSTVRSQIAALVEKTESRRLGDLLRLLGRLAGTTAAAERPHTKSCEVTPRAISARMSPASLSSSEPSR